MTYRGYVENGRIVLNDPVTLPEGSEVEVTPVAVPQEDRPEEGPTWAEVFKDVIGKAEGFPADYSRNHDHYLYGTPKE